jgi:hypothetical protein
MDSFSKFVAFYPVRNINSAVVCEVFESKYFMAYGVPKSLVFDNATVFKSKGFFFFRFFVSDGELRGSTQHLTIPKVHLLRE